MPPKIKADTFKWEPKSQRQADLKKAIADYPIVFAVGPAGTGKTAAATFSALEYLDAKKVEGIVVSRPLVEVGGEKMGFIPGTVDDKVGPYLAPIEDFLQEYPGYQSLKDGPKAKGLLETAPIAFMRGRTFSGKFVIIDEAQNLTSAQMFTVLTRLGEGSKMVLTGDLTQCDLPGRLKSGLADAIDRLIPRGKYGLVEFGPDDVLRHDIVGDIIRAYAERKQ